MPPYLPLKFIVNMHKRNKFPGRETKPARARVNLKSTLKPASKTIIPEPVKLPGMSPINPVNLEGKPVNPDSINR
jgi:hypothetical protein